MKVGAYGLLLGVVLSGVWTEASENTEALKVGSLACCQYAMSFIDYAKSDKSFLEIWRHCLVRT